MRFLADMGVSSHVVSWLRGQGHDAKHLRAEGLHRLPNGEIFRKALAEERVVLTFDLDSAEIAALSPVRGVSVVIFRLRNTRTANVVGRLSTVLAGARQELEAGAVVAVEESRYRVRTLPIGQSPLAY